MQNFVSKGLSSSIISYAFLHFVTALFPSDLLEYLLSACGLLMFIFALFYLSIKKYKLPIFLFIIGTVILFLSDVSPLTGILTGVLQMRNIIGLLIVVPLISWVLQEEPYIEDIISLFHRWIGTSQRFYLMLVGFTQLIAYFLLFGSIPMMYQFTNIILGEQRTEVWENYKSTALLRGFALSSLWVISIPSFVFAVETLGASLWIAILQGFGIAMIGTIIAVTFSYLGERKYKMKLTPVLQSEMEHLLENASSIKVQKKKSIEFFILFVTLFGSIFVLHAIFHFQLMLLIPIVILFWVAIFYLYKKKTRKLLFVFNEYRKKDVVNQAYQLNVMISVGILIFALKQTPFAATVVSSINYIQTQMPFLNPLYFLPFIVILLGFMSLGPLTVMVLVAGILESMALPFPPELIVLAITSGSVISIVISPLIMPVIVLSAANGLSLFTNGFKFNWKYAIVFYIIVQIYIQTMVHLGVTFH